MVVHYYRNVSAVIFMYDITREGSFRALTTWLQEYDHFGLSDEGEVPKLMIGNKCDLIHERIVSSNQARKFADLHNMPMWEISTKNDEELETIESIFLTLSHKLVRSRSSFMGRAPHYASVDNSYTDSTSSNSSRSRKGRTSQKRIKLKSGKAPKKKCCESSWGSKMSLQLCTGHGYCKSRKAFMPGRVFSVFQIRETSGFQDLTWLT